MVTVLIYQVTNDPKLTLLNKAHIKSKTICQQKKYVKKIDKKFAKKICQKNLPKKFAKKNCEKNVPRNL